MGEEGDNEGGDEVETEVDDDFVVKLLFCDGSVFIFFSPDSVFVVTVGSDTDADTLESLFLFLSFLSFGGFLPPNTKSGRLCLNNTHVATYQNIRHENQKRNEPLDMSEFDAHIRFSVWPFQHDRLELQNRRSEIHLTNGRNVSSSSTLRCETKIQRTKVVVYSTKRLLVLFRWQHAIYCCLQIV